MELKIKNVTFPEVIEFNFEELKQEITNKSALYKNMVYADGEIKEAKADKASLNKFVKALSDERIKVKNQCLRPYVEFETKIKELTEIVNEPIKIINEQVEAYEEKKKAEKMEEIKEFWAGCFVPEELSLEKIFDDKWLNISVSLKLVKEAIIERIEQFNNDLSTLEKLPEFSFEAKEAYMQTLDINKAINEGQRLADIQNRKAEHEAEQERLKAEVESKEDTCTDCEVTPEKTQMEPEKHWMKFEALLSRDDALALRNFMNSRSIKFKA